MGITPREFDEMTPRELAIYGEAYNRRQEAEAENICQGAYLTAMMAVNFAGRKTIPKYEELFGKTDTGDTMTDEAMFRQVRALNAVFGGTDEFTTQERS